MALTDVRRLNTDNILGLKSVLNCNTETIQNVEKRGPYPQHANYAPYDLSNQLTKFKIDNR